MTTDTDWQTRGWNARLRDQLDFHYRHQLRPRLGGLTDDEYFWEPVPGCWSVRPRAEATTSDAAGGGDLVLDYAWPEPTPAPVTTIAWRLAHVTRGCLAHRTASHFGGPPADPETWVYAGTADEALDAARRGVRRVDGRRGVARRGGPGPSLRPGRGTVRRGAAGRPGPPHQP